MRGSVLKRCSCGTVRNEAGRRIACRKAHGSWAYVLDIGHDPVTGKRRQEKLAGFPSQDKAQEALTAAIAAVNSGTFAHDGGETLAQFLPTWLDKKVADGLRLTTERAYRDHINKYLIPQMGRLRLRDIRPGHVSAMLTEVGKGKRRGPTTVRRVHATLRSALASALRQRKVAYNPCVGIELPVAPRKRVQPWEPEELGAFLDHVANDRLGSLFEVMAMTGLRRGEALGLRWRDVDVVRARLTVRLQLVRLAGSHDCRICAGSHRGRRFEPPKTRSGEDRIVDLDSGVLGTLAAHRLAQDAEREQWAEAYQQHDLVFALEDGSPFDPVTVSRRFKELEVEAGARHVKVHGLRHGQASLMLAAGVDIALVSKRLGHSTIGVTADTYSHLLEGVGRDAADRAAALVPRKRRDQSVTTQAESDARRREVAR